MVKEGEMLKEGGDEPKFSVAALTDCISNFASYAAQAPEPQGSNTYSTSVYLTFGYWLARGASTRERYFREDRMHDTSRWAEELVASAEGSG